MKNLFEFFKSRAFLKNLGIALGSLLLLGWLILKSLDVYTHHGKTIAVPDFSGLKINDLNAFINDRPLKYLVIDSIYDTKKPKGVVIKQEPDPGVQVKQDRTIYLYVTSILAPRVSMPNLEDRSLRQAVAILETYGLKLARPLKRKPDVCNGCVLSQEYKGKHIKEGAQIERGAEITLTIGEGRNGDESVGIPDLSGLTLREAILRLNENNLNEGIHVYDRKAGSKTDTADARIYKQNPAPGSDNTISAGSSIDLYLTNDRNKIKKTGP
jgi:beta-lactam-binding protein with PASTA domain